MLNNDDTQWLMRQIAATAEMLGSQISPLAAAMMAEDLSSYDRPMLATALARVRSDGPPRLSLKAVLDAVDAAMGRPGANEAWAVALVALDERNTVVWTSEVAQAWAVAAPIAKSGDLIGARMAFKDAYERLLRSAREQRLLPVVTVSAGWDAERRVSAVENAVSLGYMHPRDAAGYLPAPVAPGYTPALLLDGMPPSALPSAIRARLLAMREAIAKADGVRIATRARDTAEAAQELADQKAKAQNLTDQHLFAADAAFRSKA